MALVWVPSLLRNLTGGQEQVRADGETVGQVLAALDASYPGIKARLCAGEQLVPAIAVSVDGRIARRGLAEPVRPESEIRFLQAIAGG